MTPGNRLQLGGEFSLLNQVHSISEYSRKYPDYAGDDTSGGKHRYIPFL